MTKYCKFNYIVIMFYKPFNYKNYLNLSEKELNKLYFLQKYDLQKVFNYKNPIILSFNDLSMINNLFELVFLNLLFQELLIQN